MRTLAFAHLNGEMDRLEDLQRVVQEERPELVVCAGNLLGRERPAAEEMPRVLHRALHTLAALPCAVAVVPGELDAPERLVLPITTAQEWTERHLHCIHGMFMTVGDMAVAGFGGQIMTRERETETALRYPAWEARYRTAFLSELDQALMLVAHHPPAEMRELDLVDGQHFGSPAITELIGTWRPRGSSCRPAGSTRVSTASSTRVAAGMRSSTPPPPLPSHRPDPTHGKGQSRWTFSCRLPSQEWSCGWSAGHASPACRERARSGGAWSRC
jgi:Icc-related predicted phosphoesterase